MSESVTDEYVVKRYEDQLTYYAAASKKNARWYKNLRVLTIVLGATLTLISTVSAGAAFENYENIETFVTVATPVLAALLSIIASISQTFQYGSAWQESALTNQSLREGLDRFQATPADQRDPKAELNLINDLVMTETASFFNRIMGRSAPRTAGQAAEPNSTNQPVVELAAADSAGTEQAAAADRAENEQAAAAKAQPAAKAKEQAAPEPKEQAAAGAKEQAVTKSAEEEAPLEKPGAKKPGT